MVRCWLDGEVVPAAQACVSPLDAGWRLGDGVFSTLRAVDGEPQRLAAHVARILHDASALGITGLDPEQLADAARVVATSNAAEHPDLVLRMPRRIASPGTARLSRRLARTQGNHRQQRKYDEVHLLLPAKRS